MSDAPRTVSGKWMILGVFGVGIAMAIAAWTYYYFQQRRPLQFWGPSAAQLIMQAPQVEAWRLADAAAVHDDPAEVQTITLGKQRLRIMEAKDVSTARGLSHLRYGLMNDRCFAWDAKAPRDAVSWQYALRFVDGKSQTTLLVAPEAKRVRLLETGAEVSNAPVAEEYFKFFQEHFPEPP